MVNLDPRPLEDFTMWVMLQRGGQKSNIPALKQLVNDWVKMTTQKTAGQRKDRPKDLSFDNLERVKMGILIKLKEIHFAWDYMKESESVLRGLKLYASLATRKPHGQYGTVFCLTNYDTTMEENLYRIYTLRDMGYDPYVMIYDKPHAQREIKHLQRWCNNRMIFKKEPDFHNYNQKTMD